MGPRVASATWLYQVPAPACRWQDASRGSNAWVGQFLAPCQIDSSGKFSYILAKIESSALSAKIIIRGKRGCTEAQLINMFKQEVSVLPLSSGVLAVSWAASLCASLLLCIWRSRLAEMWAADRYTNSCSGSCLSLTWLPMPARACSSCCTAYSHVAKYCTCCLQAANVSWPCKQLLHL